MGEAIKPISILMDEKDVFTDIIVEGLPPGVTHDGKGNISGKPQIGNWSDDIEEIQCFRVYVTVRHTDLKSDINVNFDINVLHPKSTQLTILPGNPAPEAPLPPDDAPEGEKAEEGAEKPVEKGPDAEAEKPVEKGPDAEAEKPSDLAEAGASEGSESREERIISQNTLRVLTPGTPEYEELEAWIAEQEAELKGFGPMAPREGRVKAAIALYEGSQNELDYVQGILLGLQKMGYELDRKHLSVDILSAQANEGKAQRLTKRISQGKYDLVIAIGAPMARMLKETLAGKVPLVCGMVDSPVSEGLSGTDSPVTGILQRPSLKSLLSGALFLKPETERIALIHATDDRRQEEIETLAGTWGVETKSVDAADPDQLLKQAEMLLSEWDLIFLTEDFQDEEALKKLAAMALESGKLVCGASRAQIAAGLPAACVMDARKAGESGGWLSALVLSGQDPASIPWQPPEGADILYRPEAMTSLGITPPVTASPWMDASGQ